MQLLIDALPCNRQGSADKPADSKDEPAETQNLCGGCYCTRSLVISQAWMFGNSNQILLNEQLGHSKDISPCKDIWVD